MYRSSRLAKPAANKAEIIYQRGDSLTGRAYSNKCGTRSRYPVQSLNRCGHATGSSPVQRVNTYPSVRSQDTSGMMRRRVPVPARPKVMSLP